MGYRAPAQATGHGRETGGRTRKGWCPVSDPEQERFLDDDCLELIAEQVTDLVCPLSDSELSTVFWKVRRNVADFQSKVEAQSQSDTERLSRLLED